MSTVRVVAALVAFAVLFVVARDAVWFVVAGCWTLGVAWIAVAPRTAPLRHGGAPVPWYARAAVHALIAAAAWAQALAVLDAEHAHVHVAYRFGTTAIGTSVAAALAAGFTEATARRRHSLSVR